jgi:hypothetical protein
MHELSACSINDHQLKRDLVALCGQMNTQVFCLPD